MNLCEYQKITRRTAIYLSVENSDIIYPALGLIGECGEIADKVKKFIRDDQCDVQHLEIPQCRIEAIKKELGDCCWYLANICCDIDFDLDLMYKMRGHSITQQIRSLALPRLVIHMNVRASSAAKALEDWYYTNTYRHTEIADNLSHIIVCIETIASKCNLTLEEICIANIENLTGRKKRGTLHGSGDNR